MSIQESREARRIMLVDAAATLVGKSREERLEIIIANLVHNMALERGYDAGQAAVACGGSSQEWKEFMPPWWRLAEMVTGQFSAAEPVKQGEQDDI